MGAIAAANLLETSDHDADILSVPLALLRTTGPDGFRSAQLHFTAIESQGWEHYFNTAGRDGMGIFKAFRCGKRILHWIIKSFFETIYRQPALHRPALGQLPL